MKLHRFKDFDRGRLFSSIGKHLHRKGQKGSLRTKHVTPATLARIVFDYEQYTPVLTTIPSKWRSGYSPQHHTVSSMVEFCCRSQSSSGSCNTICLVQVPSFFLKSYSGSKSSLDTVSFSIQKVEWTSEFVCLRTERERPLCQDPTCLVISIFT